MRVPGASRSTAWSTGIEPSYDDILAMPLVERRVTLTCVSNQVGDRYVGNATWLGVPMRALLERAG